MYIYMCVCVCKLVVSLWARTASTVQQVSVPSDRVEVVAVASVHQQPLNHQKGDRRRGGGG